MPSQGPRNGTIFLNDASFGTKPWADPGFAAAFDGFEASVSSDGFTSATSQYLAAKGFGFTVPSMATILGILCEVRLVASGVGGVDARAQLVKADAVQTTNKATGASISTFGGSYRSYGGASDLWGTTWTPAEINAAGFGFVFAATAAGGSSVYVDHIRVTVTYVIGSQAEVSARGTVVAIGSYRGVFVVAAAKITLSGMGPDFALRVFVGVPGLTELTPRLRRFSIRRGRPGNLERVEAGTCSVTMRDDDGALDPSNVASPYYPYVRVLAELLLQRRRAGVTYPRFRGRLERMVSSWQPPRYQEQELTCSDAFEALAAARIQSGTASLTTALVGANNDLVFTAREAGPRGDELGVQYIVGGASTALAAALNDPVSGSADIQATNDTLDWYRGTVATQAPAPPAPARLEIRGNDALVTVSTDSSSQPTATAAQVKAIVDATPELAARVSVEIAAGDNGSGVVTVMPLRRLTGGKWPQERSGARIERVLDLIGWPASLRRIDPGLLDVVTGGFGPRDNASALSHIQDVASSELGYFFVDRDGVAVYHDGGHRGRDPRSTVVQVIFGDASAGAGYLYSTVTPEYSTQRLFNRVLVTAGATGAEPQMAEDVASQILYSPIPGVPFPREHSRATLLASDADALVVARTILAASKDARVRFERIRVLERDIPSGWTEAVMALELGDRVQLRTKPPGHNTVGVYDCFVEQIEEEGNPDGSPVAVTLGLSSATESLVVVPAGGPLKDSSGDDFVLDSSTAGVLG